MCDLNIRTDGMLSVARCSKEKAVFKCILLPDFAHQADVEHNQAHE